MSKEGPSLESGNSENREGIKPVYTALFVKDTQTLVEEFPPRHAKVFGHHSTIAFKPPSLDGVDVGAEGRIQIIGRAQDEKGDVLLVKNPKSHSKHPHITLSCAEGVPPSYSNELLANAIASNSVEYFDVPKEVAVVEGYFDGKNDVVTTSKQ